MHDEIISFFYLLTTCGILLEMCDAMKLQFAVWQVIRIYFSVDIHRLIVLNVLTKVYMWLFSVPWHKSVSQSLATSKSTALKIDLSMCKVEFPVCHAFLSIHAFLWSPAGKGLASLVFSSVPTHFTVWMWFTNVWSFVEIPFMAIKI